MTFPTANRYYIRNIKCNLKKLIRKKTVFFNNCELFSFLLFARLSKGCCINQISAFCCCKAEISINMDDRYHQFHSLISIELNA